MKRRTESDRPRRVLVAAVLLALALLLTAVAAQANVNGFESADGNQACDAAIDWACLSAPITRVDDGTGAGDDVFAGGAKEDNPNGWAFATGDANDKGDVQALWSAVAQNPDDSSFLYLAFKRLSGSGQGFFSFELNQVRTTWTNSMGATIPCRTNGDVLVSYPIPSSGSQVTLTLYKWTGSGGPAACPNGASGTWTAFPMTVGQSEGAINASGAIDNTLSGFKPGIAFPASTFGEAAIDLPGIAQDLNFAKSCEFFTALQAHSRDSNSITASLEDVVAPVALTVPACKPPAGGGGGGGGGGSITPTTPTILAQQACAGASDVTLSGTADAGDQVLVKDGGQVVDIVDADATTGAWSDALTGVASGSHSYTAQAIEPVSNTRSADSGPIGVSVDGSACSGGGGNGAGGGSNPGGGSTPGGGTTGGGPVTGTETSLNRPAGELAIKGVPASCALKPFRTYIRDTKHVLARVVFKVDGRAVATVRRRDKLGQFVALIDTTRMRIGAHTLTATLVYKQAGKKPKVVKQRFRHCDQCVSRRDFTIRVAKLHGQTIVSASVFVNGTRVKVLRGSRLRAVVRLSGLPKGTFKVRIRVVTASGRVVNSTRTYHTCTSKLQGKGRPKL